MQANRGRRRSGGDSASAGSRTTRPAPQIPVRVARAGEPDAGGEYRPVDHRSRLGMGGRAPSQRPAIRRGRVPEGDGPRRRSRSASRSGVRRQGGVRRQRELLRGVGRLLRPRDPADRRSAAACHRDDATGRLRRRRFERAWRHRAPFCVACGRHFRQRQSGRVFQGAAACAQAARDARLERRRQEGGAPADAAGSVRPAH